MPPIPGRPLGERLHRLAGRRVSERHRTTAIYARRQPSAIRGVGHPVTDNRCRAGHGVFRASSEIPEHQPVFRRNHDSRRCSRIMSTRPSGENARPSTYPVIPGMLASWRAVPGSQSLTSLGRPFHRRPGGQGSAIGREQQARDFSLMALKTDAFPPARKVPKEQRAVTYRPRPGSGHRGEDHRRSSRGR